MAIMMVLDVPDATPDQYEEVIRGLSEAGAAAPEGRLSHVAGPNPGGWLVVDVWRDEEAFGRFGHTLLPLLARAGLAHARPQVLPAHNYVAG